MILRIGIMPEEQIRTRMLAIAQGKYKPSENEPKVWFTSLDAFLRHGSETILKLKEGRQTID